MSCPKCKRIQSDRRDFIRHIKLPANAPLPLGKHDWIKVPAHNYHEYCRLCRVAKRKHGENDPCVGRPPWETIIA